MAVLTGNKVRVYRNGTPVAYATTCTMDLSVEFIDIAPVNSEDARWRVARPRRISATVSVSALYSEDADDHRFDDAFDDISGVSDLTIMVQGDGFQYEGDGYAESISLNAGAGQVASWTATFVLSGQVEKTAIL